MNPRKISGPAAALLLALSAPVQATDRADAADTVNRAVQWLHQSGWVVENGAGLDERLSARIAQVAGVLRTELGAAGRELPSASVEAGDHLSQLRSVDVEQRTVELADLRAYRDAQVEVYRALRRLETDPVDAERAAREALEILHALADFGPADSGRDLAGGLQGRAELRTGGDR